LPLRLNLAAEHGGSRSHKNIKKHRRFLKMKKNYRAVLSLFLVVVIAVSTFTGCTDDKNPALNGDLPADVTFKFQQVDKDEKLTEWDITTTETNLAEALLAEKLIEGVVGQYGLFVTAVNGVTITEDNAYWELFINGESAMVGVSSVEIVAGATYTFKYSTF
jgi:hypothetical protein